MTVADQIARGLGRAPSAAPSASNNVTDRAESFLRVALSGDGIPFVRSAAKASSFLAIKTTFDSVLHTAPRVFSLLSVVTTYKNGGTVYVGDDGVFYATFTKSIDGSLYDPQTIVLNFASRQTDGVTLVTEQHTYPGGDGQVVRISTGYYKFLKYLGYPDVITVEWLSTTTGERSTGPLTVVVIARPI